MTELTTTTSFSSSHSLLPFTNRRRHQPVISVRMEQSRERNRKNKVIVILGATGAGKSRLSIDLATRFSSEIINSDKIQIYEGLEITTNQITIPERRGVPHHLLGQFKQEDGELTAADFRCLASKAVSEIISRGKLPIIAGGSNSFIHALLVERFNSEIDPFSLTDSSICKDLRYECCFLWVDVSEIILLDYLTKRVDEMMDSGMYEELSRFYDPRKTGKTRFGIRKAIGVSEFEGYFKTYPPPEKKAKEWDKERKTAYDKAVEDIKRNTWRLAKKQIKKIEMLRNAGWEIKRVDATSSFKAVMSSRRREWREIWEEEVLEPSVKIVNGLLVED